MTNQQPELLPQQTTPISPEEQSKRDEYRRRLAGYLKDPAFRAIEGFPIGTDEDILALSDPPYYTACPNPFLPEIIAAWQRERLDLRHKLHLQSPLPSGEGVGGEVRGEVSREPFAADVSEGKNDPIYNAHSYHTKVPHKAIMRYILHYTDPGDIVFDGFCGTGMTGVAAQLCGDKKAVEELGYRVDEEGWIWEGTNRDKGDAGDKKKPISRLGARKAVLNDLSPAATFIAYNYNTPVDAAAFEREARRILREVEQECGWMYETTHVEPASCRFITHHLRFTALSETPPPSLANSMDSLDSVKESVESASSRFQENQLHPPSITTFTTRQGDLPHWQLPAAHYFITFTTHNHRVLSESSRQIVLDSLRFWDGKRLDLIAAVVMPDHVHAVLVPKQNDTGGYWDLSTLMHSIKSYSANEINRVENSRGQTVWLSETYDHIIRDEAEYQRVLTYLAYNPVKASLAKREEEYAWFYLGSALRDGWKPSPQGKINYTVWSDVFVCPTCGHEMVFWDVAVNKEKGEIQDAWNCPGCAALLAKSPRKDSGALKAEHAWETRFDRELKQTIRQTKQVPVLINYSLGKKRFEKKPDAVDMELIQKIEGSEIPYPMPLNRIPKGDKTSDPVKLGITHVHHFYTRRNLWVLSVLSTNINKLLGTGKSHLYFSYTANMRSISKLASIAFSYYFHGGGGAINAGTKGTLYISSIMPEVNILRSFAGRVDDVGRILNGVNGISRSQTSITTQSSSEISLLKQEVLDYIFIDPPFGGNLMYSELSFMWEAWLGVITSTGSEAIVNKMQSKGLFEYQCLMQACFNTFYRLLKSGRWMTIEFHNSQNSVWNAIQETLQRAGFVIADVRVLDKGQGTFNQATASGAVKQDLIISSYKPNGNLEENFRLKAGTEDGAWEFVRYHLGKLPVVNQSNGSAVINAERQAFLLFDRMVAFHIQRGVMVPISSPEFYAGLEQRFIRRDGMFFLPEQVAEYDRTLLNSGKPTQIPLFVTDEKTAVIWLRQQLDPSSGGEPQTRGDLTNPFNQIMHRAKHEKALELIEILEQNYLQDESGRWYVPDHNKASDLERVRQRSLLKEFNEYAATTGRLRQFRTEAVRAGFADCFKRQDYVTLVKVAERLPEDVLREDPDLLMYYDSALLRKK